MFVGVGRVGGVRAVDAGDHAGELGDGLPPGIRTVALAPGLTDTPGMRAIVGEEYIARA